MAAKSYTISTAGRSQTFTAANRTVDTATTATYEVNHGNVTDSLVLTKPGTTGPLTYQYVGAGFWQRATSSNTPTSGDVVDGSFDAFTYGLATSNTAMPRTGSAGYDISLLGTLATNLRFEPLALAGSGKLIADFGAGAVSLSGQIAGVDSVTKATEFRTAFAGNGQIGTGTGAFTGSFNFFGFVPMAGELSGHFYGPTANEVGLAFAVRSTAPSVGTDVAAGTVIGRQGALVAGDSLSSLTSPTIFSTDHTELYSYQRNRADGVVSDEDFPKTYNATDSVTYSPATRGFSVTMGPQNFIVPIDASNLSFSQADIVTAESNGRFTVYQKTDGQRTLRLLAYNAGSTNSELVLSYAGFLDIQIKGPGSTADQERLTRLYIPYGVTTPANQMPRSGTASYSGVVYGTGTPIGDSNDLQHSFLDFYDLTGTSKFTTDFGTGDMSASLTTTGHNLTSGAARDFGTADLYGRVTDGNFQLYANSSVNGGLSQIRGTMNGAFYGPAANEAVGTFRLSYSTDGSPSSNLTLYGVTVAKRN